MGDYTLKERYWYDGNVLRFNTGETRLIVGDSAIDSRGFVPESKFDEDLMVTDSTTGEHVVEIYKPNGKAKYLSQLLKCDKENLLWRRYRHVYTMSEIRTMLDIPAHEKIVIIDNEKNLGNS